MKASKPTTQAPERTAANRAASQRRADLVAAGKCGMCGKPRGSLKFLCDDCAARHRERQREKTARRRVFEQEYPDAD